MTASARPTAAPGALWLVPTPLDHGFESPLPLADVLPAAAIARAAQLAHWVCENAKSARAFLGRVHQVQQLACPVQQQQIHELPHAVHKKGDAQMSDADARRLLQPALQGHDLGLLSEAGMPAIADPGSALVRMAHQLGVPVRPLVGPSALLLALAGSGLDGQHFAFQGYLPRDAAERGWRIRELELLVQRSGQTQLFIETPYRNGALWDDLLRHLAPATRLAHASALTLPEAQMVCRSVADWRRLPPAPPPAVPTVFLIGR